MLLSKQAKLFFSGLKYYYMVEHMFYSFSSSKAHKKFSEQPCNL